MNLIAQSRVDELAMQFQNPPESAGSQWVMGLCAVILPIVAASVVAGVYQFRQRAEYATASPNSLFSGLCRLHGFSNAEQRLLFRLANAVDIDQPALVLSIPEQFDQARDNVQFKDLDQQKLARLRSRLFS